MSLNDLSYNLLREDWIPVLLKNGRADKVSLTGLFEQAGDISRITGEFPQMRFVILRLALAVMYRAYAGGDPLTREELIDSWLELWEAGSFEDGAIEDYLLHWKDGFDLFDDQLPFYQVAGLEYVGKEPDHVRSVMPDVPAKDEKYLFSTSSPREKATLSFDEAARYLLVAQGYDVSGIKTPVVGYTDAKNGKAYPHGAGWCGELGGIFLEGENLFQTLLLNWPLYDGEPLLDVAGDLPPWERNDVTPDRREAHPAGPVQALTWQSRRIRLVPSEAGECVCGVVMCYGDSVSLMNEHGHEMMTAWRQSETQMKKLKLPVAPLLPQHHDSHKAIWRGLPALLAYDAQAGSADLRPGVVRWVAEMAEELAERGTGLGYLTVSAQGFVYGTQNAVVDDTVSDSFVANGSLFDEGSETLTKSIDVIEKADDAVFGLELFVRNVEISGGDKRRYTKFDDMAANATKADVREAAYDALDGLFRQRIRDFDDGDAHAYARDWCRQIEKVLTSLAQGYLDRSSVRAFQVCDDMSPGKAFAIFRRQLNSALEL